MSRIKIEYTGLDAESKLDTGLRQERDFVAAIQRAASTIAHTARRELGTRAGQD